MTPEEAAQAWVEIVGDEGGSMDDTLYLRHLAHFIRARDAEVQAKAWDEGYKQGGPMHDVDYDDPDAHTRNPYKKKAGESDADA